MLGLDSFGCKDVNIHRKKIINHLAHIHLIPIRRRRWDYTQPTYEWIDLQLLALTLKHSIQLRILHSHTDTSIWTRDQLQLVHTSPVLRDWKRQAFAKMPKFQSYNIVKSLLASVLFQLYSQLLNGHWSEIWNTKLETDLEIHWL